MPLYALMYRYIDDAERVTEHRPQHRAYLRQIADQHDLILAGPLDESGPAGGLLVLNVESADRVHELADNDPFHIHGVIEERTVRRWTLSIGEDRLDVGGTTAARH